jgi:hypothetical protein
MIKPVPQRLADGVVAPRPTFWLKYPVVALNWLVVTLMPVVTRTPDELK